MALARGKIIETESCCADDDDGRGRGRACRRSSMFAIYESVLLAVVEGSGRPLFDDFLPCSSATDGTW